MRKSDGGFRNLLVPDAGFALDKRDVAVLDCFQCLRKQWNPCSAEFGIEPTAGIQTLDFLGGLTHDGDVLSAPSVGSIGGSVQLEVMNDDELAIRGMMI